MIGELTNHLWQSTFFAIAVALMTLVFRKNRANVRYWMWQCASIKFFLPFVLLTSLGRHIGWMPGKIAMPVVAYAVESVAQPFPETLSFTSFAAAAPHQSDWRLIAMLSVWACGFLAIAFIRLRLWLRVRAALRAGTALEIAAPVAIRCAPGLLEPGVVGLFHQVLLLPEGIADLLTPSELEAVLAHELCHVRRRDNLFAAVHMMVEAVFWFHPLVWWIGARLLEARERACDETVLSLGNRPRVYADAILRVCKLYVESPLVCVSGVSGSDIRRRIEAIMTNRTVQGLNGAKKLLLACAGFAALAVPLAFGVLIGVVHAPAIHAQSAVTIPPMAQVAQAEPFGAITQAAAVPANRYQDHRLVALLFDFGGMTADEQSRPRQTGIEFVQKDLKPDDLAAVMVAGSGPLSVTQDFTDDRAVLESAIQDFTAGSGTNSAADVGARLANIEAATKILGRLAGKKALIYLSSGITQTGGNNQQVLMAVIAAAKKANVAIYPMDSGSASQQLVAQSSFTGTSQSAGDALVVHGTLGLDSAPPGLLEDEYSRRLAYVQAKFGSRSAATSRAYIRYGAPDQIDDSGSGPKGAWQIWRYNYLDDFHSSAAFEFTGSGPRDVRIVYPLPAATYEGKPAGGAQFASLAAALNREAQGQARGLTAPSNVIAGLPGRDASMQINPVFPGMLPSPDRRFPTLSVPLDSLSGLVDVAGQILDAGGRTAATVRDSAQASAGTLEANFTLPPGSYVCNLVVREQVTGRTYGETIDFHVK